VYCVDADEDKSPGYDILTGHADWHGGDPVNGENPADSGAAWGDAGVRSTAYNGSAFLLWHADFIASHLAWRGEFNFGGYKNPQIPDGTPATPSYLLTTPPNVATDESNVYKYVRLGEFQSRDELGRDVVSPWHNNGHGAIATASAEALMNSFSSPGSGKDTFWKWHTIVDEPNRNWRTDQATPTMTPAVGAAVTSLANGIIITFDKKVSTSGGAGGTANTIRLTAGALKVNNVAATTMLDNDGTNKFTQFKFTGFTIPPAGEVTVILTGTASFQGSPAGGWKFTYNP
jgi:hypothetical protein